MKIRAGEDIKAGAILRTALDLNGSEYILVRVRQDDPYGFPPQFIAGRDIAGGEWIDMDTEEGKSTLVVIGFVNGMVAGEDIRAGQAIYLDADSKVRRIPETPLSQADEDRIQEIALENGLNPEILRRIALNLTLLEALRLVGLAKPNQDES